MSLSFNDLDFSNLGIAGAAVAIEKIVGFGRSRLRTTEYPKPGAHGSEVYGQYLEGCMPSIEGTLYATSKTAFQAAKDKMEGAFAPTADEEALAKDDRFLNCRCVAFELNKIGRYTADRAVSFRVDFIAQSACLYGTTLNFTGIVLPAQSGGRAFPKSYPKSYGTVQILGATLNNAGNFPYWPIVRIYGPVDIPTVRNHTTGKQVTLALTIDAGDYIEIDMAKKTVMLNDTASRFSSLTDRDFWDLQPGNNEIRYSAQTVQTGSFIGVWYRDAWL